MAKGIIIKEKVGSDVGQKYNPSLATSGEIFNQYEDYYASSNTGDDPNARRNIASGSWTHAEGHTNEASATGSHVEGSSNKALGSASWSHVEGLNNTIEGSAENAHVEGKGNIATENAKQAHVEGLRNIAIGEVQHIQGKFNEYSEKYAHIVGNGTSNNARSNAHTLDWEGNTWYAGRVEAGNLKIGSSITNLKCFLPQAEDTSKLTITLDSVEGLKVGHNLVKAIVEDGKFVGWQSREITAINGNIVTLFAKFSYNPTYPLTANNATILNGAVFYDNMFSVTHDELTDKYSVDLNTNIGTTSLILTEEDLDYIHIEGFETSGVPTSYAEGMLGCAGGFNSHSEGGECYAFGIESHAEGGGSITLGKRAHAEGSATVADGIGSHVEGVSSRARGYGSHAEGVRGKAEELGSHAEGEDCKATGKASHAEGSGTVAAGYGAHAEGKANTSAYITTASGIGSHAEGFGTLASGDYAHAEGGGLYTVNNTDGTTSTYRTTASGNMSHAEGHATTASGMGSHAEGSASQATNNSAHAEGSGTVASGEYSHAEGKRTTATHWAAHAEGTDTLAGASHSHAGGNYSQVHKWGGFAHGDHLQIPNLNITPTFVTAFGTYNNAETSAVFMIGNGTDAAHTSNLFEIHADGTIIINVGGKRKKIKADALEDA